MKVNALEENSTKAQGNLKLAVAQLYCYRCGAELEGMIDHGEHQHHWGYPVHYDGSWLRCAQCGFSLFGIEDVSAEIRAAFNELGRS